MSQENIPNIVVLVSGTVDPINTDAESRSASYSKPGDPNFKPPKLRYPTPVFQNIDEDDENWYWAENKELQKALQALRDQYSNLHVLTAHGWTGDNSVQARKGAGAYLANRLCGANKEPAYYPRFLKGKAHFHFIGHSHGGNVINELTRQAAKVWPKQWTIRSITYLSTPFFTKLHQVDTSAFHDDCNIINVFCKYDITQRVIADFSLHPMTGVMKAVGVDDIGCLVKCLIADMDPVGTLFWDFLKSVNASILNDDTNWGDLKTWKNLTDGLNWSDLEDLPKALREDVKKLDIRVAHFDKQKGIRFYTQVLGLLSRLHEIFSRLRAAITHLKNGITYNVHKSVDPSGQQLRKVLSPALAAKFTKELDQLEGGLLKTRAAFEKRLRAGKFPLLCLTEDIYVVEFLKPLADFLEMNPKTLSGPLWDLLATTLIEQIEVFDNTSATPQAQLVGKLNSKKRAFPLVPVDVSSKDDYSKKRDQVFDKFVARLEGIEQRLAAKTLSVTNSKTDVVELLFTMAAQMEFVRAFVTDPAHTNYVRATEAGLIALMVVKVRNGLKTDLEIQLLRLALAMDNHVSTLKARSFGQLEVVEDKKPAPKVATAGKKPEAKGAPVACTCGQHTPQEAKKKQKEPRPPMGSIPYLAKVAHSTSRMDLYPEVKKELVKHITTRRR